MVARLKSLWLMLMLMFLPAMASAELYITDSVTVSLFPEADLKGKPVQSVISGTPVEVLERSDEVARVKTENGGEGWVRVSLLMSSKPAVKKLEAANKTISDIERELKALQQEAGELKKKAKDAKDVVWMRAEMNKARDRAKKLEADLKKIKSAQANKASEKEAQATESQTTLALLQAEKEDLEQRLAAALMIADAGQEVSQEQELANGIFPSYVMALIALLVGLLFGAILGYRWLDRRVRKRFCGVKVY